MFKQILSISVILLLFILHIPTLCFSQNIADPSFLHQKSDEEFNKQFLQSVTTGKLQKADTRLKIVKKFLEVKNETLKPEDFYMQVSEMDIPDGKQVRHILMEIKKDIGNYLGNEGLRHYFGALTDAGGSAVEQKILSYRKEVVEETIKAAIIEFAKTDPKIT